MRRTKSTARKIFFLAAACLIILSTFGCATQPTNTPAPTTDVTAIGQTAVASYKAGQAQTQSAAPTIAQPTATKVPPTATTAPTLTSTVTKTAVVLAPATATATVTFTPTPTFSPNFPGSSPASTATPIFLYAAQYITQNIPDGKVMKPGQEFDAIFTVRNIGLRTWDKSYYYRYLSGEAFSAPAMYMLSEEVAYNQSTTLVIDMRAPFSPGRYTTRWQLINDNGAPFFNFYIAIEVR